LRYVKSDPLSRDRSRHLAERGHATQRRWEHESHSSGAGSAARAPGQLTRKAQTTIPQAVRTALGVKPGDEIAYAIADGHVLLTKAAKPRRGAPFEDPFAVFREWDRPEDDEAFGDLW